MCAKRLDSEIGTVWHEDASKIYASGFGISDTFLQLRQTYPVSFVSVKKYLQSTGVTRRSEAQKRKRWQRTCVICQCTFSGRTPTVLMCDGCVGDDCVGATKTRLLKYQRYAWIIKRQKQYGIDDVTFKTMLASQNETCGLCDQIMNPPCVDHCHTTGKVRGLLCHQCNLTLGHVEIRGGKAWLAKATAWLV